MTTPRFYETTPVIDAPELSARSGLAIKLKMECWHAAGSFKIRGMSARCLEHIEQGARSLICASGGNAGFATALAAQTLHVPLHVLVPESTSETVADRIRATGAVVEHFGRDWQEAHEEALRRAKADRSGYVHPFDHPSIWQGHATIIQEALLQMDRPDAIILSVGGGGLLCGVLEGLQGSAWEQVPLVAVETEGMASLAAAFKRNAPVTLSELHGRATSLGARRVSDRCLWWKGRHEITPVQVTDEEAAAGCRALVDECRTHTELACGASIAACLYRPELFAPGAAVLVIACGGIGISKK